MSAMSMSYFAIIPEEILFSDLSDKAIRLYCVLRTYGKGRIFPSRAKLAEQMGKVDVKTVHRALKELTDMGAISISTRKRADGTQTSSIYTLNDHLAGGHGCPSGRSKTGGHGCPTIN